MDLGLTGRRALVCAASKGLGRGCAEALAREGVDVTICARTEHEVAQTAAEITVLAGRSVSWVACDITTVEGREAALARCPAPCLCICQSTAAARHAGNVAASAHTRAETASAAGVLWL